MIALNRSRLPPPLLPPRSTVALLAACCALALPACRGTTISLRQMFADETDYDELEADRASEGAGVRPDPAAAPAATWTDFFGPDRLGHYTETPILTDWPAEGLRELWRQPVGAGYGGVVIAQGIVYTLEQRRDHEALAAYNLETGREVWVHGWPARYSDAMSGEGPRATPVYADGRVIAQGAAGELRCMDATDGTLNWRLDVLEATASENLEWGLGATPLVHEGQVIALGGEPEQDGPTVLALDLATGAVRWRALGDTAAYSSPIARVLGGQEQLLILMAERLVSLDPANGAVLWEYPWDITLGFNCSQPIVLDDHHVVVSSGYGKGAALLEVQAMEGVWRVEERWRSSRLKTRFGPSILEDGHLYGLDEGTLVCLEAATGRRAWKGEAYGYGQLLWAGDHLLVLDDEGTVHLLEVDPQGATERGRFPALEGVTMNLPAAAHGRLVVRNKLEMACFELWPSSPTGTARAGDRRNDTEAEAAAAAAVPTPSR